ncbi:hypothetical protein [Klenkia sp. PcliD-1-E]|uniref:hypothetical protein n=1 Tax=Klenkia sp. PcliD-1-E TaxID=2954492 RepID=UPI00209695C7|nr:hypothetical protein [Klenkia sp. PcliD-1-E]MCO7218892.1 hypothetical protein [Klenkia sp. PcliD-1-E]
MSKLGWVSAEDPAGDWWVLQVYDDGWVEVPGRARDLADTRRKLRTALSGLGGVIGLWAAAIILDRNGVPVLPTVIAWIGVVVLLVTSRRTRRMRLQDRGQALADRDQRRRMREQGREPRVREGRPAWRPPRSSAEWAQRMQGVRRVGAEEVSRVDVRVPPSEGEPVVVDVWRTDGSWLGYRTPDRTAVRLFQRWSHGPVVG